jgi:hypothetical protein
MAQKDYELVEGSYPNLHKSDRAGKGGEHATLYNTTAVHRCKVK